MVDLSIMRRSPAGTASPKVGEIVVNDSSMLEAAIYDLLKKHFRGESYYADIPGDDVPDGDGSLSI